MKGPIDFNVVFTQVIKQQFQMTIVPMEIVQVDNVGGDTIQLFDQPFGHTFGVKSVIAENAGFQSIRFDFIFVCIANALGMVTVTGSVKNVIFYPLDGQQVADGNAYFPGASCAANSVDLYYFQIESSFPERNVGINV